MVYYKHVYHFFMEHQKRTRIVCTIGPASSSVTTLAHMMKSGMNICRLNFSHGSYADHKKLVKNIRAAAKKTGTIITILQDLSGPKLRIGELPPEGIVLKKGSEVVLSSEPNKGVIPVQYPYLERDVKVGEQILLDDGLLELVVTKAHKNGLTAKVIVGGVLKSHKGFNLPNSKLSIASITVKDKKDVVFGLEIGVDIVALSFVRSATDIKQLRRIITTHRPKHFPLIIAKIEKQEALDNLDDIIAQTDGVMVARGDLGVETLAADVPVQQKRIIAQCREAGKMVIVATEMLASMVSKPRPTRAEVSDVANAVIDHADAVMLSGESATGEYPREAVETMAAIACETEKSTLDDIAVCDTLDVIHKTSRDAGAIMGLLANRGDVHAIIIAPDAKHFISQISYFRPHVPVFVGCETYQDAAQAQVFWGTTAIPHIQHVESLLRIIKKNARTMGLMAKDPVALVEKRWGGFELTVAPFGELLKKTFH